MRGRRRFSILDLTCSIRSYLSVTRQLACFSFLLLWSISSAPAASPGIIYFVIGSDTAIWNAGTTVDVSTRHPHYPLNSFTDPSAPVFQVMDPTWRGQFKDSFGNMLKFTWWMMGGNIFRDADNLNVPVANTMTLYLMKKYHGEAIRQFGDELSLHYHTYYWSDYVGSGNYYWNQSRTFNECRDDFDFTVAQYLLEEEVFPVSFRSGWHFMDADWQAHLNQLLPYGMHDDYGVYRPWSTNVVPIAGIEDWSHAPSGFVPFHPSTNDYQLPGNGKGWNVRSIKMQNMVQDNVDQIFSAASNGADQVTCIWSHLPENFVTNVVRICAFIGHAGSNHPAIPFRYCTAVEAMQRWRKVTNSVPPPLDVQASVQGQTVTLTLRTSAPIFQDRPFVCLKDAFKQYTNLTFCCVPEGTNQWTVSLPVSCNKLAKVGIAVTDIDGNVTTRILRYLPDDLYIDNLDSEYSEVQGNWMSLTNAGWGTDARAAFLTSNDTVRAQWALPISRSGFYQISVQVPAVSNPASNILYEIWAGGSKVSAAFFGSTLPTNQWVYLFSPFLDSSVSNFLRLEASGTNQPNTYAAADVVRIVPLPDSLPPQNQISLTQTANGYLIRFSGVSGQICELQRSSTFSTGWVTIDTLSLPSDGILEYEDKNPLPGQAFYRVLVP